MNAKFLFAAATIAWLFADAKLVAQGFLPGALVIDNPNGTTLHLEPNLQIYSPDGSLLRTFTGAGNTPWTGASVTPDGKLVTTFYNGFPDLHGLKLFSPDGTVTSFATPEVFIGGRDVSVFANGVLAISDTSFFDGPQVRFYNQDGTFIRSTSLTGTGADGSTVGTDDILYVTSVTGLRIGKVSQDGTFLGSFTTAFSPSDLVMSPIDGTLWVADTNGGNVVHMTTDGTVLSSFSIGLTGAFYGIGISPDGNSLYATTTSSSVVRQFDLDGNQLNQFSISNSSGPLFMTVVPAIPEPVTGIMLGAGAIMLTSVRCRSKRQPR